MSTIPTDHQYKAKWRWPGDVEAAVERAIGGKYTLHICCGKSPLGDVRVDADPATDPDVLVDHKRLPFDDEQFEAVVWDPPWKMQYFDRFKPFYEAVRVTELGGLIVVNAKWPCESENTRIVNPLDSGDGDEVLIVRADNAWRDASIVTFHEKVEEQTDLGAWLDAETDAAPTRPRPNAWDTCYACTTHKPLDELRFTSQETGDRFCSPACLHEFEDWLGVPLTPVDPEEHDVSHVHPVIAAEWRQRDE